MSIYTKSDKQNNQSHCCQHHFGIDIGEECEIEWEQEKTRKYDYDRDK